MILREFAIGGALAGLLTLTACAGSASSASPELPGVVAMKAPIAGALRRSGASNAVAANGPFTSCPALSGGTGLLSDGDFSLAPNPGGIEAFGKGAKFAPNWTVTGPQGIDFVSGYFQAPDGLCSVDLDGTPGPGGIEHTDLTTTPGMRYTVSFLFSGNGACDGNIKTMIVRAGTASTSFSWNIANEGDAQNGDFFKKMWTFSASAKLTPLRFESKDPTDSYCGPVVAGIAVAAAP